MSEEILESNTEIYFDQVPMEQLKEWHNQRQDHFYETTKGFLQEPFTVCPIETELRYHHEFIRLGHLLINNETSSQLEIRTNPKEKVFFLNYIGVKDKQQGEGTRVMNIVTSLADKYGYTMRLEIAPKFGVGKRVLNRFYQKFGFQKHPTFKDSRVREPNLE